MVEEYALVDEAADLVVDEAAELEEALGGTVESMVIRGV